MTGIKTLRQACNAMAEDLGIWPSRFVRCYPDPSAYGLPMTLCIGWRISRQYSIFSSHRKSMEMQANIFWLRSMGMTLAQTGKAMGRSSARVGEIERKSKKELLIFKRHGRKFCQQLLETLDAMQNL